MMMNPKEEKKGDLVEMCGELGFSAEEQEAALAFLSGEAGEEALTKISFRDLSETDSPAFVRIQYELIRKEKTDEIKKMFLLLFAAGQSTCYRLMNKTYIRKKLLLDVDPIKLAAVQSASVGFTAYSISAYQLVELMEYFDDKPDTIRQILNYDKSGLPNGKIALLAAYFQKKYNCYGRPQTVKEEDQALLNEYETLLSECLYRFYAGRLDQEALKELSECIVSGGLPQHLDSVIGRQFRLAAGAAYLNCPLSKRMENIVKICMSANWKETLEAMDSISVRFPMALSRTGGDYAQKYGIDGVGYISWALKKNMNHVLQEQVVNDTENYLKVLNEAEIDDANRMLWHIGQKNPALYEKVVEEKRQSGEFKERVIAGLLRKEPDAAVTEGYLRGEGTAEILYPYFGKNVKGRYYDGGREYVLLTNFDKNFHDEEFYRRCEVYMLSRQAGIFFRNMVTKYGSGENRVDNECVRKLLLDFTAEGVPLCYQMLVINVLQESLLYSAAGGSLTDAAAEYFSGCLKERRDETLAAFAGADAYGRFVGLKVLCAAPEQNKEEILKYSQDGAEMVKEELAKFLREKKEWEADIRGLLDSKKAAQREFSVRVLLSWQEDGANYRELFAQAIEKEKSAKVRELLTNALGENGEGAKNMQTVSREELVKSLHKGGRKRSLAWAYETPFPAVHMAVSPADGNGGAGDGSGNNAGKGRGEAALADEEYLQAVLLCYASADGCGVSKNAKLLAEALDQEEFSIYVNELFDRWLAAGAEAKKRWVLYAASLHGGSAIVEKLKQQIKEWPQHARGAIACEAVKALALNPLPQALLAVDGIARKFKFKQVRAAAGEALEFAAAQLNISREELADRIVPDLGFDENMERLFDYGERKFVVTITPTLEIEVFEAAQEKEADKITGEESEKGNAEKQMEEGKETKENGKNCKYARAKKLKSLPAPGKKDDEVKAKAAYEEFKLLKKQLKTTAASQKERLEMALSTAREWSAAAWRQLFVKNPVMHQFAIGLVWGVYEKGKLVQSFRYMEDGSFNTQDEEEYVFPGGGEADGKLLESGVISENIKIGLVHPVELSAEEKETWIGQLEDYEITQPFEQLKRTVYPVTKEEEEEKKLMRFDGRTLNDLSLGSRLSGLGWYRGSVQDGGGFDTYYREDAELGLGVELHFSGSYVGGSNEDITVYDARFYKAGTIKRGSYEYDEADDNKAYFLKDIPARYFSEVVWQLEKATA